MMTRHMPVEAEPRTQGPTALRAKDGVSQPLAALLTMTESWHRLSRLGSVTLRFSANLMPAAWPRPAPTLRCICC